VRPTRLRTQYRTDARERRFAGGFRFMKDGEGYDVTDKRDVYRVVLILKDPVEALVSRYGHGHCMNLQVGGHCSPHSLMRLLLLLLPHPTPPLLATPPHAQGSCGPGPEAFPPLEEYARRGVDSMGMTAFLLNYLGSPPRPRDYGLVVINYHKLWDNVPLVLDALGLPRMLERMWPAREETRRNQRTAEEPGGGPAHAEATRRLLRGMYGELAELVQGLPAVMYA
jgi:hypothetical protein